MPRVFRLSILYEARKELSYYEQPTLRTQVTYFTANDSEEFQKILTSRRCCAQSDYAIARILDEEIREIPVEPGERL